MFKRMSEDAIRIRKEIRLERRRLREIIDIIMKIDDPEDYDSLKHEMDTRVNRIVELQERLKTL